MTELRRTYELTIDYAELAAIVSAFEDAISSLVGSQGEDAKVLRARYMELWEMFAKELGT